MSQIFNFIKKCNFDEKSVIFEIGSHMGIDTKNIKNITKDSKIHCFEPDPRNIKIMLEQGIDSFAIINEIAISDKDSESETLYLSSGKPLNKTDIKLVDDNDWSASNSLRPPKLCTTLHPWCKFKNKINVKVKSLDSYCKENNVEYINFIWMDVQGAEDLVINGAQEILLKTEYIYTEFSNIEIYQDQKKLNDLLSLLPGNWKIMFVDQDDVLLENVDYRNKLINNNGSWNIKNLNEHVFDSDLAEFIYLFLKSNECKNCLDLGCGPGEYVKYLNKRLIKTDGYDGNVFTPEITNGECGVMDLSVPNNLNKLYDCVLSLEVGEHIPEKYQDVYLQNLFTHCKKFIIISWAIPNQTGYGHVNCQDNSYIKSIFKSHGYNNLIKIENVLRKESKCDWFKHSIMVFEKGTI